MPIFSKLAFIVITTVLLSACSAAIGAGSVITPTATPRPTPLILPSPTPVSIPTVGNFRLSPAIAQRAAEGKPLVIRVSYHDISNEFAPFIRRGVVSAVEDLKANVEMIGPVGPDAAVQIAELERLLDVGIDGLAISPVDDEALVPIINRYLEQGIPVVTFNTDNPVSDRLAFAGQNLDKSGYEAAQLLAEALNGRGDVIITTMDAQAPWSISRETGARRALAEYPEINIVETVNTGMEPLEMYTSIEKAMTEHQSVTGILSLECCSTPPAGEYVKRNGLIGTVKVVGFDELPRTLDLIEAGAIEASISQDPERQSYEAVRMLADFINGETETITNVDTGIAVIRMNNVSEFVSK